MPRIFVAEGDGPLRQLLRTVLEDAGHEVFVAADGAEALTLADTVCPELLITDYRMPIVDGVDLATALWARHPFGSLPMIVYTAYPA